MNSIFVVDKPEGFTSFDVVAKMRGILGLRRVGHAGTLDPMATGVLPVFAGRATRVCDIQPDTTKEYVAQVQLGYRTDTLDRTGTVTARSEKNVTAAQFETALKGYLGEIWQTPPMYSAVQIGGRRLYELARKGQEVERPRRKVTIMALELLSGDEHAGCYMVRVRCSAGTYVRTLFDDLGEYLGTYGTLTALRRTAAGVFREADCFTLAELQALKDTGRLHEAAQPVDRVFESLEAVRLNEKETVRFCNGAVVRRDAGGRPLRVYGADGLFLGTGKQDKTTGLLRVDKLLCERGVDGREKTDRTDSL